jgi:acetoin utilization protein AcuB
MLTKDCLSSIVPVLHLSDTADQALDMMNENQLLLLPLVGDDNEYLGIVQEDILLDWDDTSIAFKDAYPNFYRPSVRANTHVFEAAKVFKETNLQLVPVIDDQQKYIGSISQQELLQYFAKGVASAEDGAILVLSIHQQNYSLGQLTRVFESEGITILSILTHPIEGTLDVQLTIKINKQDVRFVMSTLEKLQYSLVELHSTISDQDDLESNYNSLMSYLNI